MDFPLRVHVRDINHGSAFPSDLTIRCTSVPGLGHAINLFEILPPEELGEEGWWYIVERVEWSLDDESKAYEPIVTVRRELKQEPL